jgi:hypothetical protein
MYFVTDKLSDYLFNLEHEDLETPDKKTGYQSTEMDHRKEFNSIPDIQNKADG